MSAPTSPGPVANFILSFSSLENSLKENSPLYFDLVSALKLPGLLVREGRSFLVEKVEWNASVGTSLTGGHPLKRRKHVILKYFRRDKGCNYDALLLSIRAFLHDPISCHPNIVRLLCMDWRTPGLRGVGPVLAFEHAEFGTLAEFQTSRPALTLNVKRKLCHDVSKGLSILHACNLIHGDLRHENVLVFKNLDKDAQVDYVAKLNDFSTLFDLQGTRSSPSCSGKHYAPEGFHLQSGPKMLKSAEVYSLGCLMWRVLLDGQNPFESEKIKDLNTEELQSMKFSNSFLPMVKKNITTHSPLLQPDDLSVICFVLEHTIQSDPSRRSLRKVVAALQVNDIEDVDSLISKWDDGYEQKSESGSSTSSKRETLQGSVITYAAKSLYGDYDYLSDGHTQLCGPNDPDFVFDPQRLKFIIDWDLQSQFVRELKQYSSHTEGTDLIPPVLASFYLFQCYMHEFGVAFDATEACHWLLEAARWKSDCQEAYLAQAWCWRVHKALDVPLDVSLFTLRSWMQMSIFRGHRACVQESKDIINMIENAEEKRRWEEMLEQSTLAFKTVAAGVGMPFFIPRKLYRVYSLMDLDKLDAQIHKEFAIRDIDSVNKIVVNDHGDGLLHLACGLGSVRALKHLVEKYEADIDLPNGTALESPLLTACRGGHLQCAIYLLSRGAKADGSTLAAETPLYWLAAFPEEEVMDIATRLVKAGALLTTRQPRQSSSMSSQWHDVDELHCLPASPLSRAVMMDNLPAVKALLTLGADPMENFAAMNSLCPITMAAVLTMPRILNVLLLYLEHTRGVAPRVIDELEMLFIASTCRATVSDITSLQSRLVRCGVKYKTAMRETLGILYHRRKKFRKWYDEGDDFRSNVTQTTMAAMVKLGRVDVVASLLELQSVTDDFIPDPSWIVQAVEQNNEPLFRLLIGYGSNTIHHKVTTADGSTKSLLQLHASRPASSRPGIFISEALLRAGVPADPLFPDGSPSAFVLAVRYHRFDLADVLLRHGADIDFSYALADSSFCTTILGDLIRSPNTNNLEALQYLLGHVRPFTVSFALPIPSFEPEFKDKKPLPNFIVDIVNQFSILHFACSVVPRSPRESEALTEMLRGLLEHSEYCTPDKIDLFNPRCGTALWLACALGQVEVVSILLEKGANSSLVFKGFTPAAMAQRASESAIDGSAARYSRIIDLLAV